MAKPRYEEVRCKSLLNRVRGMDFAWSINPYRGCVHSCHYCFARRYHSFLDLDAGDDFSGIVFVKVNAAEVLRHELARPSWKREMVALGTATDPYQPIEGRYRTTRGILEALRDYRTPATIVTKGSLIVRDIDVLASLTERAGCTVCFSITTLDEDVWRRLEPGTPPPRQRLRAMERLVRAGVNAGVMLAPVAPGVTDSITSLDEVARTAAGHGARFLSHTVLRLNPLVKEHFTRFLHEHYPQLLGGYRRMFPGVSAPQQYAHRLSRTIDGLRQRYNLPKSRLPAPAEAPPPARQLAMAL